MEEKIVFERFLYGDDKEISINDVEFLVDRIVLLPKIRPHKLDKAVGLSAHYCQNADFRLRMIEKSKECPVLVYQLYKKGVFIFEDIKPHLKGIDSFLLYFYFRDEIDDFKSLIQKIGVPYDFDKSFIENEKDIDLLIEYGFVPYSIEYCLKYDDIEKFENIEVFNKEPKWSPFEWSIEPDFLDFLSFSGFFGSLKCFRYLLMKGFEINDNVTNMVICSGCLDLFHLCQANRLIPNDSIFHSIKYCHLSLLAFFIENGVDINAKNDYIVILCFIFLLFILLLNLVI